MKLIDLLVQELPKRGGWPVIALAATSAINDSHIRFITEAGDIGVMGFPCREAWGTVTREQYEAALAASQQPAWNGEGMPPVGCECEAKMPRLDSPLWGWRRVKVVISGMVKAENECLVYDVETTRPAWADEFRPIRTEEERKRDGFINQLMTEWAFLGQDGEQAGELYDAIAAGKIPGVKLED